MSDQFTHEQFISPFTWRYGSTEMRSLWSEAYKRRLWRRVWIALARAQHYAGLVTAPQLADLEAHAEHVNVNRALEIEAKIHHDLMAEVRAFAEQCQVGGGIIHLGATSADVEDNADAIRIRESLDLVIRKLAHLLDLFADQIDALAGEVTMAFTHVQPAEPTTMGYRLALYAQDLLEDYSRLHHHRDSIRGKGIKGAVGTRASYAELLAGTDRSPAELEADVMAELELPAYPVTGQTYPRKQDWHVLSALAGLAASIHKFAFDLRLLQSPVLGEWAEPFGRLQVGSSAMPFKRNPIQAEKLDSLCRLVRAQVDVAWDNAALSLLERTLDDSASRREILPVAFLAVDEILTAAARLVRDLRVDTTAAQNLLRRYGPFAATERVLMHAVKAGADRQEIHEHLREHSLLAWAALREGQTNPLIDSLAESKILSSFLTPSEIRSLLTAETYTGDAEQRARAFAQYIRSALSPEDN